MSLFLRQRDLDLFNKISNTLIENVVETSVNLYKLSVNSMIDDLYGDSLNKVYYSPIKINALIEHEAESTEVVEAGVDVNQIISAKFQRNTLREKDIYPEIGDILEWNYSFYEIDDIDENQFIAGNTEQNFNFSIICKCHLTRRSKVQIEEFRSGVETNV